MKIGDTYFVSTVDIRKPMTRYPQLQDGYDRDTGEGVGHLFKFETGNGLRAYFMPEDEKSTLYIYEAEVK